MIGTTVSHYEIVKKLGEGGMGMVYQAKDTRLNRPVALKFLGPHLLHDREARIRFNREAQAAASLTHPNICPVLEIDEADGRLFIAMVYLEGMDLGREIAAKRLPIAETLDIAIQIAMGLDEAYRKGVIHCDIKPANIMQTRWGAVITDFGLANFSNAAMPAKRGSTAGTISYMSPEQTLGAALDHRTDIWSLGVLLYEMVSGQLPFRGNCASAIMHSILNETATPLKQLCRCVPIELEHIVSRALRKRPAQRYQCAGEIMLDLQELRRSFEREPRQLNSAGELLASHNDQQLSLPDNTLASTVSSLGETSKPGRYRRGTWTSLWLQDAKTDINFQFGGEYDSPRHLELQNP